MIEELLGRFESVFASDFMLAKDKMKDEASRSTFVIIGGAGTIGSAVVRLLVSLEAKNIQVVDISENNLVELTRDIRSSKYNIVTEIETYAMDCGSEEFVRYFNQLPSVDYLLNFSALKHVRSERDVYTLKRLVDVVVINSVNLLNLAEEKGCKKYFCVSTDKAANPVSMMGASKLLMEKFILSQQVGVKVSTARFPNVAFSDGSLLFGFENRLNKKQPLAIPTDIRRYFLTPEEAGQLCVLSCLIAGDKEILFPKTNNNFEDISLVEIASAYLRLKGFEPAPFDSEKMAKESVEKCIEEGKWPCFYFESDTTGEKPFEEFYAENEKVDLKRFDSLGVVCFDPNINKIDFGEFANLYDEFKNLNNWTKARLVDVFKLFLPNFLHEEKNKNLDQKM